MDRKKLLEKYKYPLLVLCFGLALMLLPASSRQESDPFCEDLLSFVLSRAEGAGETRVIVSDNGVVVVSEGAADARMRLEILRAVESYTGFGSDKITVLKMAKAD